MRDIFYGEGGAFILLGIDEFISHYFDNPDIIPHAYKWAVPFLVIGLVFVKRYIIVRMGKKAAIDLVETKIGGTSPPAA